MEPPFTKSRQLYELNGECYLPGQPRISLTENQTQLYDYLQEGLCTEDADRMAPHLWLMSSRSSSNIAPLHFQRIKNRHIVITEKARLHLVWMDDRIFIKPLPPYLLSYDFWKTYLSPTSPSSSALEKPDYSSPIQINHLDDHDDTQRRDMIRRSALGLLRSYIHLIKYQSDLETAVHARLLPPHISLDTFCAFSSTFATDITDADVNPRYSFGELRLSRLNYWCKIWLGKWHYQTVHGQYHTYFARFYGPLLFIFGCFSVMLSALQVEMAVESLAASGDGNASSSSTTSPSASQSPTPPTAWPHIWTFSRVFSVMSLCVVGFPSLVILALLIGKPLHELRYALTH